MGKRKDYSSGEGGNYAQFQPVPAGVRRSQTDQAGWNEISQFTSRAEDSLVTGFPAPYTLPEATYLALGGVKTSPPFAKNPSISPLTTMGVRVRDLMQGRHFTEWSLKGATTTPTFIRMHGTLTPQGTANGGVTTGNVVGRSAAILSTGAAAPSDAGVQSSTSLSNGEGFLQARPYMMGLFKTPATLTNFRMWFGLGDASLHTADDPAANLYAVRLNPTLNANFTLHMKDAVTLGTTDTGVAAAAATWYLMELWYDGSNLYCRINGTQTTYAGGNVPSLSFQPTTISWPYTRNTAANIRDWHCSYGYFSQD